MALASGTRLGPYEIVEPLGAGGMGEVYRARDPRLSREVAVKLIATEGEPSPDRLRRFETEARAAAQLSHPNVVTVHDVGTHEGHPYLVLELLEGETLREALRGGLPPLRQAVSWALEVSRGLGAAHERGIVHRDLKPENVFLTRDGRVKVLDFGLAKLHEALVSDEADRESPTATKDTSPGVLLGTIGYMSPEQVKGETPDARTDVFALGALLYELVTGRKAFGGGTAPEVLASILRDEPPALESQVHGVPASLEAVVRRCLGKRPSDRFSTARGVEAALETVLAGLEPGRVSVVRPPEPRGPYPGLSSFTEADAGRFFGREAEVESLWGKLRQRKLLALIGPSGAGKTSFVRAGLVPSRPSGWGALVATPGSAPMRALAEALVEELPSDADTMKQLLGFDDPEVAFSMVRKWRESYLEALLVVDQFEELFTLNPPEAQERFAELLGHLVKDGDVHVLVSLRDDFLMRCDGHGALRPVFGELTPLSPLTPEGLRRALTEPAKREGFAFEDEALVAEMLESVQEARGALPLLAFAVARLWEKRARERKLLTRKAYEEIGGVAGALAQHAEQTLERIGLEREPLVRELFRNLVTAQWTRAVADREELLSVLPDREAGGHVLDQLIDARLLTSYEVREAEGAALHPERSGPQDRGEALPDGRAEGAPAPVVSRRRIEIIHESLLRAWPRLVRWQAQDEEGAVLRDQLKQASRLWEEKGRPDDLLWTGTSEREFELWQDRYPGKLTALEGAFAKAMVGRVRRRKRVQRVAVLSAFVALLAVLGVIGVFWRRSVDEARRAEAGKLLALAERQLEKDPTEALAYATASLELADTYETRIFATRVLWGAPPAFDLILGTGSGGNRRGTVFSPDGCWLAAAWPPADEPRGQGRTVRLWPLPGCPHGEVKTLEGIGGRPRWIGFEPGGRWVVVAADHAGGGVYVVPLDGRPARRLPGFTEGGLHSAAISPSGRQVAAAWGYGGGEKTLRVWDVETGESRRFELPAAAAPAGKEPEQGVFSLSFLGDSVLLSGDREGVRRWDLETGRSELILENEVEAVVEVAASVDGQTVITLEDAGGGTGRCFAVQRVQPSDGTTRTLGEFGGCARGLAFDPSGGVVVTGDRDGVVRVGRLGGGDPHLLLGHAGAVWRVAVSPDRRWIASAGDGTLRIWRMPDLGQTPIHTLPHDELVAKLESLTNVRVVRDPESAEGWKVGLDRFPGWKDVPTWFAPAPEWSARMEADGPP